MDIVLGVAVLAIVGIALYTLRGQKQAVVAEAAGRAVLQDTIARGIEPFSLHPVIDPKKCVGTGACVQACPEVDVIAVIDGLARTANPTACIGHAECVISCPVDAITLVMGSARRGVELPKINKDFETTVPGLYVVGELGGMGLIYNAVTQALQCIEAIARTQPAKRDGVHQLVIVGAGPAGIAASVAAKDARLDAVTVDQQSVGGTILQYPRQKIVMTRPVKLPIYGKLQLTTVSKEELLEKIEDVIQKTGISIRTGVKVSGITKKDDIFEVATDQGPLLAQRVVLALGRRGSPRKLGVPGEERAKVTYRLLEPESYARTKCLVVGGGDSAVEAALALGDHGAEVVLAYRGDAFGRIKPMNQKRLDAATAAGRVRVKMKTEPVEIQAEYVVLQCQDQREQLPNDYVIVQAGGELPTQLLKAAGIAISEYRGEQFAPAGR